MRRSRATPAVSEAPGLLLLLLLLAGCADPPPAQTPEPSDPGPEIEATDPRPRTPDPRSKDARRAAARAALIGGHIAEGKALLAALWEEAPGPDRADDLVLLMAAEAREGAIDRSLELLDAAEAARLSTASLADLAAALSTNLPDPAVSAAKILATTPATRSAAHAAVLARLHERSGEVRASIPYWSIAARLAPEEPSYLRELARLHATTGNPRGLETTLRRLVEVAPRDLAARIDLVRILSRAGRHTEALARARMPEALLSGTEGELFTADILLRTHLPDDALPRFDAILKRSPEHCDATFGRARTLLLLGKKREAIAVLHALIARKLGAAPCRVVEAVRLLARLPSWKRHRRRLERLRLEGGGADPAALRAILEALGTAGLQGPARAPRAR